ncbi:unnamed protein product [Choristocarpus tenellus]
MTTQVWKSMTTNCVLSGPRVGLLRRGGAIYSRFLSPIDHLGHSNQSWGSSAPQQQDTVFLGTPKRWCGSRSPLKRDNQDMVEIMNRIVQHKGRTRNVVPKEVVSMFCSKYLDLDASGKEKVLLSLARDFTPTQANVYTALEHYTASVAHNSGVVGTSVGTESTGEDIRGGSGSGVGGVTHGSRHAKAYEKLRHDITPANEELLRTVVAESDNGVSFVVGLREDLLGLLMRDGTLAMDPHLRAFDGTLRTLLQGWFSAGFLELRRITYEKSGGAMLEKIARYEAVHPVRSLSELKERLGPGRRCFAFLHPCIPEEPLVFVHVALLPEMAASMAQLKETTGAGAEPGGIDSRARWAVFYSISSPHIGIRGVPLGNFLIKRVVAQLKAELPQVVSFATLSPIPSFRMWLTNKTKQRAALGSGSKFSEELLLAPGEAEAILEYTQGGSNPHPPPSHSNVPLEARALEALLEKDGPLAGAPMAGTRGSGAGAGAGVVETVLMRLASRYLIRETVRGRILDPVGHFHVSNGASVERVNWMADTSEKGLRQSFGLMVNYLYVPI